MECEKEELLRSESLDEEEEYMRSLNASLLIQTPLQVSLEMIQKRLRKQAQALEALNQRVASEELAARDTSAVLERLREAEAGLLDLRSSKLSPFVQAEVLDRLGQLETVVKEQSQEWKVQLEALRLDQKLEMIKLKHASANEFPYTERDISEVEGKKEETGPTTDTLEVEGLQQAAASGGDSKEIQAEKWREKCETQLCTMQTRVDSLETLLIEKTKRLEVEREQWQSWCQEEIAAAKKLASARDVEYCEFAKLDSKVEMIQGQLQELLQCQASKEKRERDSLQAIEQRLEAVEAAQKLQAKQIETAMSTAIATLSSHHTPAEVTWADLEQLRAELSTRATLADLKRHLQTELGERDAKGDSVPHTDESPSRPATQPALATRFVYVSSHEIRVERCLSSCLSCDRAVLPPRLESVGELSSSQGYLPFPEEFKARALNRLQPLGPGLNAAELRKLHFISDNEPQSIAETTPRDSRPSVEAGSTGPIFLYDDRVTKRAPPRPVRRSKTPVFL